MPYAWGDDYEALLPYIRNAFNRSIADFEDSLPDTLTGPLGTMVRRLGDPDPALRGHPRTQAMKHANPYSLERFVSELNLLASRAESGYLEGR